MRRSSSASPPAAASLPVRGALAAEEVLDAAAQAGDVPRQVVPLDHLGDPGLEALAERDHVLEGLVGEDLVQRRPHRR